MKIEITDDLINFIRKNQDLIARGDFKAFYALATASRELIGSEIGSITWLLYQSGVDPLPDLPVVPECFLYGCKDVERFIIPDGPTLIKRLAFAWCDNLTEIIIPASILEIPSSAFDGCDKLKNCYYRGTVEGWEKGPGRKVHLIGLTVHCSNGDLQYVAASYDREPYWRKK